jgi:hypothetical protein
MESRGRFCVSAFDMYLASVTVKTFSSLSYFINKSCF